MAIPRPRMHLRYAQPRIPFYLSRAKDIKDAFKVCPTPDPCLVVEGQRHMRFPGVPRTKSSILLIIRIHQIWWRATGLPTTLDAFNAIPRRPPIIIIIIIKSTRGRDLCIATCVARMLLHSRTIWRTC
jgi:hypothetical protein